MFKTRFCKQVNPTNNYKLQQKLFYDRIDVSEGIDLNGNEILFYIHFIDAILIFWWKSAVCENKQENLFCISKYETKKKVWKY